MNRREFIGVTMGCLSSAWAWLIGDRGLMVRNDRVLHWGRIPIGIELDLIGEDEIKIANKAICWIEKEVGLDLFIDDDDIVIGDDCGGPLGTTKLEVFPDDGTILKVRIDINKFDIKVISHEIGHALGLDHDDLENSIMYPRLKDRNMYMTRHDKNLLRKLYGGEK